MNVKQPLKTQNTIVNYGNIVYLINEEENTAGVIDYKRDRDQIYIIPKSIRHRSKKYDVTSILDNAFSESKSIQVLFASDSKLEIIGKKAFFRSFIKSIMIPSSVTLIDECAFFRCPVLESVEIPDDSKLHKIEKDAFSRTSIKCIKIPSELVDLKEGWCNDASQLTKIIVSPANPRYCCYEDKMIIGKTSIDQDNYDCLIFCVNNIRRVRIPNFIEHICPYTFEDCKILNSVEIPDDSKLQTIERNAFAHSSIKDIRIPSSVTSIGEDAFFYCEELENVEIPDDSKLQTIGKSAFCCSLIKKIRIPSELVELKELWCNSTKKLTKIIVSPRNPRYCCLDEKMIIGKTNIDQDNYDCLIFCVRDAQHIRIPNFIERICVCSFDHCEQLETIEIPYDSKLRTIERCAFCCSSIKNIRIPSSVTSIGENAFSCCFKIQSIEIPDDSKLQSIGSDAFYSTSIECIKIPSELVELKENWCINTEKLTKIIISPTNPRYCLYEDNMIIGKTDIDQDNYDCLIFCVRNIRRVRIPNFIEHICSGSFDCCKKLGCVEIPYDTKLQTIGKYAFSNSSIKNIRIPSSVTMLGNHAFYFCQKLKYIEIPDDSKLQTIGNNAFTPSEIESIVIPSSVTFIAETAFAFCLRLQIIEINNFQLISKDAKFVQKLRDTLFMVPVQ